MHLTGTIITLLPLLTPLTLAAPTEITPRAGYKPGWCTFHLDLWKPDNGEWLVSHDPYKAKIDYIYDGSNGASKGAMIGGDDNPDHAQPVTGATAVFDSVLPEAIMVATTDYKLQFSYGDQHWDQNSAQCKNNGIGGLGGASGKTALGSKWYQIDCGFECK